ncbi:MAG: transposase [Rhodomicrobium sp.]|nr:transposase [Rhodomicrobium sp.]
MKPRERWEAGQRDLFRPRLDQIMDMMHALVRLALEIDWAFLEREFGAVYPDGPGSPPLPVRLMVGLHILKYSLNLSDERVCEVWVENPYFQYFRGEEFFQHRLTFDRSSMTLFRQRMGEEKLKALLQESLAVAVKTKALKPSELTAVVVDTTVQPKNVAYPTARLRRSDTGSPLARRAQLKVPVRPGAKPAATFAGALAREAFKPGAGEACPPCQEAWRPLAPILSPRRKARADQAAALRPCEAVQAGGQVPEKAQDLPWQGSTRHPPQDARQQGSGGGLCANPVPGSPPSVPEEAARRPKDLFASRP